MIRSVTEPATGPGGGRSADPETAKPPLRAIEKAKAGRMDIRSGSQATGNPDTPRIVCGIETIRPHPPNNP